ncbi:MAG TPA: TIR domain-containing protein, partial [Chthoniobacteraceae bacterium]|nr:TIR domain-containing protein [Chthoniobacteraceae bacterium]
MGYDVFISYHSQDHAVVGEIAKRLHERGVTAFLDRWYLPKGRPWRSLLEENIAGSGAVAVFVGAQGMGPWQLREIDVALERQTRQAGFPVIPVLLPGSEPPLGFLGQNTWIDQRNQPLDQVVLLLEKSIRGEPPGPDSAAQFAAAKHAVCPYRGLLYFREEDAPFFFGREAAIEGLHKAVAKSPLVAVVGASGSGKSSVVRAGLVPRLRKDRHTVWEIASLVPTDEPLKGLAAALVPFLFPELDAIERRAKANKLAAHFADGSISLRDMVRDVLDRQTGTQRLLLLVDQWEELYTLTKDTAQRERFIDELLDASTRAPLRVVLTLRGDFVGNALAHRALSDRLQGAQVNLGPMTAEELKLAIRSPAKEVGLEFESGLAERILADVGEEPGHLPLLEFVLRELWDKRQHTELLHDAYDRMGGLHGAVAAKADALFENLSAPEQEATRHLFLRLVHVAEDGNDTRRRELFSDLPKSSHDLVKHLADERLLVTSGSSAAGGESVEVAHETLIRNWVRLTAWLNANRDFLLWRERLCSLLGEWQRGAHHDELLLRGPVLGEAEDWLLRQGEGLVDDERQFIRQSIEARQKRQEEERLRQERELERERQRRVWQERARASLVKVATAAIGFAIAGVGIALIAFWYYRSAGKAEQVALSRASEARQASEEASRARTAANQQLAEVNWQLAQQARGLPFAASEESPVNATWRLLQAAKASQDAGQLADRDNAVLAARAAGAQLKATMVHGGPVNGVLQSADGRRVLTWSGDGTARLWDATDGQPVVQFMKHEERILGAAFSPDQLFILTWGYDGTARLRAAANGEFVGQPMEHQKSVRGAVFSADQTRILTWTDD